MWAFKQVIGSLFLSPLATVWLVAAGLLLRRRWPRGGPRLAWMGLALLYLFSIRLTPVLLDSWVARWSPDMGGAARPGAIVVLGGGRYRDWQGEDRLTDDTVARLATAAVLARRTGLPLLVSGGAPEGRGMPEAVLMVQLLREGFGLQARWVEPESVDTADNARRSALLLRTAAIRSVYLITHARHEPRALLAFRTAGLDAIPDPVVAEAPPLPAWRNVLPSPAALHDSARALHELVGLLMARR